MYLLKATTDKDILNQIAEFIKSAASAERHHASRVHKGKKIARERSEYAARMLDQLAIDIRENMKIDR